MADLGDMSAIEKMLYGDVEGDADLEAELLALEAAEERSSRPRAPAPPTHQIPVASSSVRTRPPVSRGNPVDFAQIGQLARQISKEAVITDDDDDPSVENEPDLLDELNDILGPGDPPSPTVSHAPPQQVVPSHRAPPPPVSQRPPAGRGGGGGLAGLIQERIEMYKLAISNANKEGNSSKSRRLNRGLKTLESQLKAARAGRPVNEEEIPPPCGTGAAKPPPPQRESSPPPEYAPPSHHSPPPLPVKPSSPPTTPSEDDRSRVIADSKPELSVDVATMEMLEKRGLAYKAEALKARNSGDRAGAVRNMKVAMQFDQVIAAIQAGEPVDLSLVPPSPSTVPPPRPPLATSPKTPPAGSSKPPPLKAPKTLLEGLEQRYQIYKETGNKAAEEGNERKERMMIRIQKQYKSAISACKAGRSVNVEELPVPPGCPPMPGERSQGENQDDDDEVTVTNTVVKPKPQSPGEKRQSDPRIDSGPSPAKLSKHEEQLQFLVTRQLQFKKAALLCKKKGDVNGAKKYLVQAKGFDQMIEASKAGLPVDITKTPVPPQLKTAGPALQPQVPVRDAGDDEAGWSVVQGGRDEIFATLEKTSFINAFPSLQCNPDLGEDDLELGVIRGLQVKLPSGYKDEDGDIFVRYEFPFPQEQPQTGKTAIVKGTSSPAWNERCKLSVNRKSRQLMRLLKRQGIKFEVYQKGGFLRSDKLLGVCEVKLAPLEGKADIHQSFDLMEGRKPIGGKLEIRIRIREPFVSKVPEMVKEKWLVIDEFAPSHAKPQQARKRQDPGPQRRAQPPNATGPPRGLPRTDVRGLPKVQM